jgi:hypothetical protein
MASQGSGQLSVLADMMKKMDKTKNTPKNAFPGLGRRSSGSMGSKLFKPRNSQAGLNKESETLNSPIMHSFMAKLSPGTPITDSLKGKY